jgi:ketosteroid isomerase-like protein
MKIRLLFGLLSSILIVAISVAVTQMSGGNTEEQAIRRLDAGWSAAAESKDVAKVISYYAEDGAALPFNAPLAKGKEQTQKLWAGLMSIPGFALSFAPTKIEVAKSGEMAYDVGTFELKLNDANGKSTTTPGKYVVVWKKQADKQWKAVADVFNTDK